MTTLNDSDKDFEKIEQKLDNPNDKTINELSEQNLGLQKKINEERFLGIFLIMILVDCYIFCQCQTWGGPVCLSILEIFFLFILGVKLGNDTFVMLISTIMKYWGNKK